MAHRCPPPPAAQSLPDLAPGDVLFEDDLVVARIYHAGGPYATTWRSFRSWGPAAGMRFDHQPRPTRDHLVRSISYAAINRGAGPGHDPLVTAIAECFQRDRVIDRNSNAPWLSLWTPARRLRLLQLSDTDWILRAGANAALTSGSTATSQRWSRAIWRRYDDLDGLCWSSSARPAGRSVALYERAADALPAHPSAHLPLTHPALEDALARIAGELRYTLLP